jgi:zinc protease
VVQRQAELPIVYLAYHVPSGIAGDAAALEVLSTVLSGGRASRLYRGLVSEGQIALEAGGDYTAFMLDPYLFWFWATPLPGQKPETVEAALLAQMERLKADPVADEELQRAKNQIEADLIFARDSVHRRANQLAQFELLGGYALDAPFLEKVRAVTAADLSRVARTYFPSDRKNVGILLPRR